MSIKLVVYLTVFLCQSTAAWSQAVNLGFPPVYNYPKGEYMAGSQNWDIAWDDVGYTWFANNAGILQFDGNQWTTYKLPNETIARSLTVGKDGIVYVGGQGSFGYLKPNNMGLYQFYNLSNELKGADADFEDVWDVIEHEGGIFFRTDNNVFLYQNKQLKSLWPGRKKLNYIGVWQNELVLQDGNNRLYTFSKDSFVPKTDLKNFDRGRISGAIALDRDTLLVTTIDDGIFYISGNSILPWKTSDDAFLRSSIIFCADISPGGQILLGTSFSGLIVIDKNHRIQDVVQKKNGLQNNSVLSIKATQRGNVWLGLDNGIDLVELQSPVRVLYPDGELQGTGYAVSVYNGRLYFGTNTGLYTLPLKSYYAPSERLLFSKVSGSQGQVWNLSQIGGKLMMGHHDGAFEITGTTAVKKLNHNGIWNFHDLGNGTVLSGNYTGFQLYDGRNNSWNPVQGFKESSRIVFRDGSDVWMAHPYRGIYHFSLNEILKKKISSGIKPLAFKQADIKAMLYKVQDKIWVAGDKSLYQLGNDYHLKADSALTQYIRPENGLKFMMEDDFQNIWYNNGIETGMLVPEKSFEPLYKKYVIRNLNGKFNEGFPSVYALDPNNIIIPSEKGFLFFDALSFTRNNQMPRLFLSKVVLNQQGKDSILWKAHLKAQIQSWSFASDENNVVFSFGLRDAPNRGMAEYNHLLQGTDKSWSGWDANPHIALQRLPPGSYTLVVKARYDTALESETISITFKIRYPWYRSLWAYLAYAAMLAGLLFYYFDRQRKKHAEAIRWLEQENALKEKEHQLKSEIAKEEIIKLQNENLKSELGFKNQELTSFTYHLVNKNELINEIRTALLKVEKKFPDHNELKKEIRQVYKLTEQNSNIDEDWENFVKSFDQVHANFFKRLTDEFGDLSPNDYKMCTYLRMNLTSKEIASLMNISIRSVETNRYRLRKKLGLDPDTNLVQFLMKY